MDSGFIARRIRSAGYATVLLSVVTSVPAGAQKDYALAGRLSCTTEEKYRESNAPRATQTAREISCTFQPSTGQPSKFTGTIGRSGELPDADTSVKRVLVWLVHGPTSVRPADLAGVYSRTTPPQPSVQKGFEEALISADGAVALIPPVDTDQLPGHSTMTVLELTLSSLRI